MVITLPRLRRHVNWRRARGLAALGALAFPAGGAGLPRAETPRAQPALLRAASAHPAASMAVIVQQRDARAGAARLVAALGGRVTKDLHIIDGFAATLPARAVARLASAPGVRYVSLDAPTTPSDCAACVITSTLQSAYIPTIGADRVWNEGPGYNQGQGMTVAVVDSGINADHPDFMTPLGQKRVVASVNLNSTNAASAGDGYGHGTHVAGIIGGNSSILGSGYDGVAPKVGLLDVRVSADAGATSTSDVVAGLQWVYDHRAAYNIRVVNLSITSSTAQSYNVDPLDAACEILWFNKVVVTVAAGNNGATSAGTIYAPANDPFVITVGASNDKGTASSADDTLAPFSAYGTTVDKVVKPDLVAPGVNIVSTLAGNSSAMIVAHLDHMVRSGLYFRLSGTSMAAPMVAGAAALLLQSNPNLTPDQVKSRLKATARPMGAGAGSGELNVYAAVHGTSTASANTGVAPSKMLTTGSQPMSGGAWTSANWSSANWSSANWSSANWSSANWSSDYWGP